MSMHASTVSGLLGSPQPFGKMADKVEEKVALGNADHLVTYFHEQAEAFRIAQAQPFGNGAAKIAGAGARIDLKCLHKGKTTEESSQK